jgi:hypothetical protein
MDFTITVGTRENPRQRQTVATAGGRYVSTAEDALIAYAAEKDLIDSGSIASLRLRLRTDRVAVADIDDVVVVAKRGIKSYDAALSVYGAGQAS